MKVSLFILCFFFSLCSKGQIWNLDSIRYQGKTYWLYPERKRINVYEEITNWKCGANLFCKGLPKNGTWIQLFLEDSLRPAVIWNYRDIMRNGEWTEFYIKGNIKQHGYYTNDEKTGRWISYFENGNIESDEVYDKGKLTGHWKCWNKDGWLWREGNLDSCITEYFSDGSKYTQFTYFDSGQINKEWYQNGQLKSSQTYIFGEIKDTIQTTYYENGQVQASGRTKKGTYYDNWKIFYPNGQLQAEGKYAIFKSISTGYIPDEKYISYKTGIWSCYYESGQLMAKGSYKKDPKISKPGIFTEHKASGIKNGDWQYFDQLGNKTTVDKIKSEILSEE